MELITRGDQKPNPDSLVNCDGHAAGSCLATKRLVRDLSTDTYFGGVTAELDEKIDVGDPVSPGHILRKCRTAVQRV